MLPGVECRYVKAPSDETARQLTATAPDLEHPITAPDSGDPACMIDELVGIRRTAAVILGRHLIKDPAVAPCGSSRHVRQRTVASRRDCPFVAGRSGSHDDSAAPDESELPAPTTPTRLLRPGESERLRSLRPGDRASSLAGAAAMPSCTTAIPWRGRSVVAGELKVPPPSGGETWRGLDGGA